MDEDFPDGICMDTVTEPNFVYFEVRDGLFSIFTFFSYFFLLFNGQLRGGVPGI